ncbi:hypothetical protein O95_00404, partial [Bartonella henselae JK 53]
MKAALGTFLQRIFLKRATFSRHMKHILEVRKPLLRR